MPYLRPGNPWFNLPLRIALEIGLVLAVLISGTLLRVRPSQFGAVLRRWTQWEWVAFLAIGSIELAIIISVAGGRWPRLAEAGVLGGGLAWAFGDLVWIQPRRKRRSSRGGCQLYGLSSTMRTRVRSVGRILRWRMF